MTINYIGFQMIDLKNWDVVKRERKKCSILNEYGKGNI